MDWSGVDYLFIIVMFLSDVWTLILTAPIHCRASIAEQVMQCYISPNLMKKTNSEGGNFQKILILGWTIIVTIIIKTCFVLPCCYFENFWQFDNFIPWRQKYWCWKISIEINYRNKLLSVFCPYVLCFSPSCALIWCFLFLSLVY